LTARPDQAEITVLGESRSRISTNSQTRPTDVPAITLMTGIAAVAGVVSTVEYGPTVSAVETRFRQPAGFGVRLPHKCRSGR
jgi:hypothetical protein